jgi:hypothetical protein
MYAGLDGGQTREPAFGRPETDYVSTYLVPVAEQATAEAGTGLAGCPEAGAPDGLLRIRLLGRGERVELRAATTNDLKSLLSTVHDDDDGAVRRWAREVRRFDRRRVADACTDREHVA